MSVLSIAPGTTNATVICYKYIQSSPVMVGISHLRTDIKNFRTIGCTENVVFFLATIPKNIPPTCILLALSWVS